VATRSDDEEKIWNSITNLAEGPGYSVRRLLTTPMLELFPQDWDQLMQVASCDELVREYAPRAGTDRYAAAVEAALNLHEEFSTAKPSDRLAEFRRRWHQEHPLPPPRVDLSDDKRTWDSTRKWWDAGKEILVRSLATEIRRRDRAGWPEPSRQALDRIKAVLHSDEEPRNKEVAAREEQEPQATNQHGRRRRRLFSPLLTTVVIILVLAVGILIWLGNGGEHWIAVTYYENTRAATCSDVGNDNRGVPDPMWSGPFRAAYQAAGGKAKLGCPRTDDPSGYVHGWGAGTSQDLQGGPAGMARIMALDPEHVIVMAGAYWQDYTDLGSGHPNPNAAQEEGYPTSNPFMCGPARLVLLADSQHNETPGAMVTAVNSEHFIWLPKPIWLAYKAVGGPFGSLGQPSGQEQLIPSGISQPFEHGSISLIGDVVRTLDQYGHVESINLKASSTFQSCINSH
jgi:hypothetical protein